ncbi:MAG: transcription antitermination factor NusB [bacterium]
MNARRAARELAILAFSQLNKKTELLEDRDIEDIILASIRTLADEAENSLKPTINTLLDMKEYLENYEIEHPENIKKPLDALIVPVPMPLTSDMIGKIDSLIDIVEKSLAALELAEISTLINKQNIKNYIIRLIKTFEGNKQTIDEQISKICKGWSIERLVKIDRDILRISIVELLYFKDIPVKVSIDEAVELAKKYSTEESSSFINGILREVVAMNNLLTI